MRGGISALVVFIGDSGRVEVTGPNVGRSSQGVTVLQEMAMATQAAPHYESAVRAMSQAAAEAELTHAPVRLAYWRMAALDGLLARLEELRLAGERVVPEDIRELVVGYAQRYDAQLSDRIDQAIGDDLNAVHDALFEAQGRVMLELAELRRGADRQGLAPPPPPGGGQSPPPH